LKKQDAARDETVLKKLEARRKEILRRQAINFYLTRTETEVRSVDPQRLAEFVGGLPSWVQTTLDQYPPDEARRRLSFAYRLVFPFLEELKGGRPPAASPAQGRAVPSPKGVSPSPAKRKPDASTDAPF
jgi:flagellar motor switch protein FliM